MLHFFFLLPFHVEFVQQQASVYQLFLHDHIYQILIKVVQLLHLPPLQYGFSNTSYTSVSVTAPGDIYRKKLLDNICIK